MKIINKLSLISIVFAAILIALKLQFDIETYKSFKRIIYQGYLSPVVVAGGIKTMIFYLLPALISLTLSVVGMFKRNNFRITALFINIITIIYLIIPVGLLLIKFELIE